jgi:flagellar biosynthesis/type III secretory pathway protein FliH
MTLTELEALHNRVCQMSLSEFEDWLEDRANEGYDFGHSDGNSQGYDDGYKEGYDAGFSDGENAGQKPISYVSYVAGQLI